MSIYQLIKVLTHSPNLTHSPTHLTTYSLTHKGNDKLRVRRQNLIREQGFLELILRLVHRLKAISIILETLQVHGGKNVSLTLEMDAMLRMGSSMLKQCFQVIYYCIKDNAENQMYVANHMTVLLTHIRYSLTNLLTHSLTYSLTHLLTHSPTHSLTYSLTHLLVDSPRRVTV
jgi:hypothetical protein